MGPGRSKEYLNSGLPGKETTGSGSGTVYHRNPALRWRVWRSFDDGPPVFPNCGGDPCVEETGGIQPGGSLHWSDGTVDIIQFQSDVSEIPEPSTVILLAPVVGLTLIC